MSFDENLVKKKTKEGFIYIGIGIFINIPFWIIMGYFLPDFSRSFIGGCGASSLSGCNLLLIGYFLSIIIGIGLIIKGIVTLVKRKKLTNKERIQKSDIKKDEKIKQLEERLQKVEEESKSENNSSSQEKNQQDSENS